MAYFVGDMKVSKEEFYQRLKEIKAHVALINDYVSKVQSGEITLEEVPQEYYQEVYDRLNPPEPEPEPDPRQSLIDELISEVNK